MLKKVIVAVLVGGLSIGLIAGAINRTASKSDQGEATAALNGRNQGRTGPGSEAEQQSNGSWNRNGVGIETANEGENGGRYGARGGNGNNANPADPVQSNKELAAAECIYSMQGTVLRVDDAGLILLMPDGEQFVIEGRSWTYAMESGFSTAADHTISLLGFDEDGEYKIISMLDLDTLASTTLREDSGRPLWAGRGRRNA
jgi:hypothetical protein